MPRAKADLLQKQALLEQATADWNRAQDSGTPAPARSPQSAYDQYKANYEVAKANVDIDKANIKVAEAAVVQDKAAWTNAKTQPGLLHDHLAGRQAPSLTGASTSARPSSPA